MPTSRLQHTIAHFRAQLLAQEQQAVNALSGAHRHLLVSVDAELNRLYDAMTEALASGDKLPASWLYEAQRLEHVTRLIRHVVDQFATLSQMLVGQGQHASVALGEQAATRMLDSTVPDGVTWTFGRPSLQAISELVGVTQDGSPLADLFAGFGQEAAQGVTDALLKGVSLGRNPRQIAPEIADALDVSRQRALVIARQEMLRCYKNAATETYRANPDVCEQWRWTCALSGRTCAACFAMDGSLHDLEEDLESHVCCRCQPVPVTRSWQDILSDAGIDTSALDLPDTQPTMPSGADWLANQDEATQQQVLGNKYAGYKAGDFSLSDLVGHKHDPDWGHAIYVKPLKALGKP